MSGRALYLGLASPGMSSPYLLSEIRKEWVMRVACPSPDWWLLQREQPAAGVPCSDWHAGSPDALGFAGRAAGHRAPPPRWTCGLAGGQRHIRYSASPPGAWPDNLWRCTGEPMDWEIRQSRLTTGQVEKGFFFLFVGERCRYDYSWTIDKRILPGGTGACILNK
jgi:hypothetical protein